MNKIGEIKQLLSLEKIEPVKWDTNLLTYYSINGNKVEIYFLLGMVAHYLVITYDDIRLQLEEPIPIKIIIKLVKGLVS